MMRELLKLKRKWALTLIPAEIIIILICANYPFIAEYFFGRFVYRILSVVLGAITRWFPFSVAEMIIYASPIIIISLIGLFVRKIIKGRGMRKSILMRSVLNVFCFVSIASFMFVLLCGTNYYRYSFMEYVDYEVTDSDKEDLYGLCLYLADKVNEARDNMPEDNDGLSKLSYGSQREFFNKAEDIMSDFSKNYPSMKWSTGSAKPVLASRYMSYTDIVGIFIPFTMEANVNVDTVAYNQLSDVLHELSHLRGIMREDEANYVSYLACVSSKEPEFIYSGYMMAYIYASNKLYDEDYDMYYSVRKKLSDKVIADLVANSKYWRQFDTPVGNTISSVSNKVNNTYLSINGQKEGTKSYGMVVDLLLAEYKSKIESNNQHKN